MFRPTRLTRTLSALLLAALLSLPAAAQVSYEFGGELAADFGVAFDGTITVAAAGVDLRLDGEVGSGFFPDAIFVIEGQAVYDAASETSPFTARLGRAYATVYLGSVDLSAGNMVVSWGSTDVINPVDVINPRDLSFPVADPASQKLATPMIRAVAHASGGVTVDAVLVPVFVPSTLPGARWLPADQLPAGLPPGVTIVGIADPLEARPAFEVGNVQFGLRATLDLDLFGGADVSAVYYRGFRHQPAFDFVPLPAGAPGALIVQPLLGYDPVQLLGTDFSAVVGQFVLRGEAAYTFTGAPGTIELPGGVTVPAPVGPDTFEAVLGAETNVPGGPYLSFNAMWQHAAQVPATPTAAATPASDRFSTAVAATFEPNARTGLDFAWLHSWSDGSGLVRPSLSYTFADGLTGTAEAAIFYGADGSEYGAWRSNSQVRVGVAFAF